MSVLHNRVGTSNQSTSSNPAGFLINEKTGETCPNCGSPMIAINFNNRWFSGCSAYHDTGCRHSKKLPLTKPLLNANGQEMHLQAIQNETLSRNDTIKKLLTEALNLLNSQTRLS